MVKTLKWHAPRYLKAPTRKWAEGIAADFVLENHHYALLVAAAGCLDRVTAARELVDRDGVVVDGRFGKRVHPAVLIEKDNKIAFARLLRELNLDTNDAAAARPPGLRYRHGG